MYVFPGTGDVFVMKEGSGVEICLALLVVSLHYIFWSDNKCLLYGKLGNTDDKKSYGKKENV